MALPEPSGSIGILGGGSLELFHTDTGSAVVDYLTLLPASAMFLLQSVLNGIAESFVGSITGGR